jgi:nitrile hydratase
MNGVHDCGGTDGYGPVQRRSGEPLFKHPWERRLFGMLLPVTASAWWGGARRPHDPAEAAAYGRSYYRSLIESLPPAAYINASYYELHLFAIETALIEAGVVSKDDLARPSAAQALPEKTYTPALRGEDVAPVVRHGAPSKLDLDIPPRFRAGERVVAVNEHPTTHTRLPRYARGRPGVVIKDCGVFECDDSIAEGQSKPQHLYEVRFAARDLWGETASAHDSVVVNLWDDHLSPA